MCMFFYQITKLLYLFCLKIPPKIKANQIKSNELQNLLKDLIIVGPGLIALVPFWVPDDIESCNFHNLLVSGFPETSQNLMSFRQLLFSLFHGGVQRKKSENPKKVSNVRHPYLRILFPFISQTSFWPEKMLYEQNY